MTRKKIAIILGMSSVIGFFVLRWIQRKPTEADGAVEAAPKATSAQVVIVKRGSISRVLALAGQFQPYQVIDVHPKVSGFIRRVNVDIGDEVRQGQTLAVLEVPELQAQLKGSVAQVARSKDEIIRAQREVDKAEAEYAARHADNERMQAAGKAQPGLIAQQDLDDIQSKDLAAAAKVDAAKAALAATEGGYQVAIADSERVAAIEGYTNVVAPIDGVITWRYADSGALIQSGRDSNSQALPIVKLAQSSLLRLRLPVPEDAVKYVKVGDQMQIRVDALDRSFTGKVVRFTRNVNFETRTMETEVDVENKDLSIVPGMYANTQLELVRVENVLTIPVEALVLQGNQEIVDVLDRDNRVHERAVELGLKGSKLAEIKNGLFEGDRVILGGQSKYQDAELVHPVITARAVNDITNARGGTIDLHNDQSGDQ
jgi:RND family efflux transporter MFP subunit